MTKSFVSLSGIMITLMLPVFAVHAQSRADDGGTAVQTGNGSPVNPGSGTQTNIGGNFTQNNDGYTTEEHERILQERVRELRKHHDRIIRLIQTASDAERAKLAADIERLSAEREEIESQRQNLQSSYEARVAELQEMSEQLSRLGGNIAQSRIEAAMEALLVGKTAQAAAIFKEVAEIESEHLDRASEAMFQLGLIAEAEVKWAEAVRHYVRAADIFPTYARLKKAADIAERNATYEEAAHYAERLVELSKSELGPRHVKTADALSTLAFAYQKLARFRDAERAHSAALDVTEGQDGPARARHLSAYAVWLHELGRAKQAQDTLQLALAIKTEDTVEGQRELVDRLETLSDVYQTLGHYETSQEQLQAASDILASLDGFGPRHPDYLNLQQLRAINLFELGRYEDAIALMERILADATAVFGPDHPALAAYYNSLLFVMQDRPISEAMEIGRKSLAISEAAYGKLHPDYALELQNLAGLIKEAGGYREAELLYEEALRTLSLTLGKQHQNYLLTLQNYSNLLVESGRRKEGINGLREVLAKRSQTLGNQHPYQAASLINLGIYLTQVSEFDEAKQSIQNGLEIIKAVVGEDSRWWVRGQLQLVQIALYQGQYDAAEHASLAANEASRKLFGETSLPFAIARNDLGTVYAEKGRLSDAASVLEAALETMRLGGLEDNPLFAKMQSNLATVYTRQRQFDRAVPILEEAAKTISEKFDEKHPTFALAKANLGYAFLSTGKLTAGEDALLAAEEAMHADGGGGPMYHVVLVNLGYLYRLQEDYTKAESYFRKAMDVFADRYGKDHPGYVNVAGNLAYALKRLDRRNEALALYEEAQATAQKYLDPTQTGYAWAHGNLATHLIEDGKLDRAAEMIEVALDSFKQIPVADPSSVATTHDTAGFLAQRRGQTDGALEYFRQALEIRKASLPADDRDLHDSYLRVADVTAGAEKEAILREFLNPAVVTLDPFDPNRIRAMNNLALVLEDKGARAEAVALMKKVLALDLVAELEGTETHVTHLHNIAIMLRRTEDPGQAEQYYRDLIKLEGGLQSAQAASIAGLARVMAMTGRARDAESLFDDAVAGSANDISDRSISILQSHGEFLARAERYADALPLLQEAADIWLRRKGPRSPEYLDALFALGIAQTDAQDFDAAEETLKRGMSFSTSAKDKNEDFVLRSIYLRGRLHARAGWDDTGEPLLRKSASLIEADRFGPAAMLANSKKYLAIILARKGKKDEAKTLFIDAYEALNQKFGAHSELTLDAQKQYNLFFCVREGEPLMSLFRIVVSCWVVLQLVNSPNEAAAQSKAYKGGTAVQAGDGSPVNAGQLQVNNYGASSEEIGKIIQDVLESQKADGLSPEMQHVLLETTYAVTADLRAVFDARAEENANLRDRLSRIEDGAAKAKLEQALALCEDEDCTGAAEILNDVVEAGSETVGAVAEARYQLGLIAEEDFRFLEAAEQFELSARLEPTFARLEKASASQILIGRFDKAENFAIELVALSVKKSGAISHEAAEAQFILGRALVLGGSIHASNEAFRQAVEIGQAVPGRKSPDLIKHLANYSNALLGMGALSEAEKMAMEALKLKEASEDIEAQVSIFEIQSKVAKAKGDFKAALAYQLEAVAMQKEDDPESATGYAATLADLTSIYLKLNDVPAAIRTAEEALAIKEARLGRSHIYTIIQKLILLTVQSMRSKIPDFNEQMQELVDLAGQTMGTSHPGYVTLIQAMGLRLASSGRIVEGRKLVERSLAQNEAIFGKDHQRYIDALSSMSTIESLSGNLTRAIELQTDALERMRGLFGDRHFEVALEAFGLGLMLLENGRAIEALRYIEEASNIYLATYGPKDPEYVSTLAFRALSLQIVGRQAEALKLATTAAEVVEDSEEIPGFATLQNRQILSKILFEQGHVHAAEPHVRAVIDMSDEVTGGELLEVAAKVTLGAILLRTERAQEAITLLEPLVEEIGNTIGDQTRLYGVAKQNLGEAFAISGQTEKAETAMREALRILDGPDTPTAMAGVANQSLGTLLINTHRTQEGLQHLERSLELAEQMEGEHSRTYIVSLSLLAQTQSKNGQFEQAEKNARRASDLAIRHHAPVAQAYVHARGALTKILADRGKYDEAFANQSDLVAVLESTDGVEPWVRLVQQNARALLLDDVGRIDEAIDAFRALVSLDRAKAEGTTPKTMRTHLTHLAWLLYVRGEWDEAEALYREALEIAEQSEKLKDKAQAIDNLADFLSLRNRKSEALNLYEQAIALSKEASGPASFETANHMFALSWFFFEQQRFERAYRYLDRGISALEASVGTEHEAYARFLRQRAILERELKDFEAAEITLLEAKQINAQLFDARHGRNADVASSFARLKLHIGDLETAEAFARRAVDIRNANGTDATFELNELAKILRYAGKLEDAEDVLRVGLKKDGSKNIGTIGHRARMQIALARTLVSKGDFHEAVKLSKEAVKQSRTMLPNDKNLRVQALTVHSRALMSLDRFTDAEFAISDALVFAKRNSLDSLDTGYQAKQALGKLKVLRGDSDSTQFVESILGYLDDRFGPNSPVVAEAMRDFGIATP